MGNKFKKWLVASAIVLALAGGYAVYNHSMPVHTQVVHADTNEVTIENTALKNRLYTLLGKADTDKLYVNDFVTHDDYKVTEDTYTHLPTANIRYLNLDGLDIHNIIELAKFEWPSTLSGVSLARNNITNEDMNALLAFTGLTADTDIEYHGNTFKCVSDISTTLLKINLNFNNISLNQLSATFRDNAKFLFGIQNVPEDKAIDEETATNVLHYIRTNDATYLSYNIRFTDYRTGVETSGYTSVTTGGDPERLIDNTTFGTYKVNVSSLTKSQYSYFYGYNDTLGDESGSFKHISVAFANDFFIERGNPFVIPFNLTNLNNWASTENKIIIKGFDHITDFYYEDVSTKNITTEHFINKCKITVTGDGITKEMFVDFVIRDTIKPKIDLRGKALMYISRGKTFVDPGYKAYDPISDTATDGEDLGYKVRLYDDDTGIEIAGINTGSLGTKKIRYVVSDLAGNVSIPVVRTVIILENVLDTVDIRINDTKIAINKEIEIIAEPGDGTPLDKYKDYKYVWYLDGVQFRTTDPIDNISKKTSTTVILDKLGVHEIKVVLTAKQVSDNTEIEVESKKEVTAEAGFTDNQSLLLAIAIVIVAIILIITFITYLKHRKGGKSTHHKTSAKAKKKAKKLNETGDTSGGITVIKDYHGDTTGGTTGSGSTGTSGSGGGNENNRLPETEDQRDKE